ncbi:MAG TPA: energy transducer TonB [Longimicrobium sp.]
MRIRLLLCTAGLLAAMTMPRAASAQACDSLVATQPAAEPASPGDSVFALEQVDARPQLINVGNVAMAMARNYPREQRDAGTSGCAVVRVEVRPNGRAGKIEVLYATIPAFGRGAIAVVRQMHFHPATREGHPVAVWMTLPLTFQLQPFSSGAAESSQ